MPEPGPASLTLLLQPASLHTGSVPVMCARGAQSPGDTRPLSQVTLLSDVQRAPGTPRVLATLPAVCRPARQREGVPAASKPLSLGRASPGWAAQGAERHGGDAEAAALANRTLGELDSAQQRGRPALSVVHQLSENVPEADPGATLSRDTRCLLTGDRSRAASTPEAACQCLCPGHARVAGSHQAAPGLGHSLRTRPHTP